jgi:hypothetical protein
MEWNMVIPDRHSLIPALARLLNRFDFSTPNAGACVGKAIRVRTTDPEIVTAADIARARSLLSQIESTGVRFPAEVYDAIDQAVAAHAAKCWSLKVDRGFYSALGLLEAVVRSGDGHKADSLGCYDAASADGNQRGWTVIINNRLKVVNGKW